MEPARLLEWLDARPVELLGLSVLLAGATALTGALWLGDRGPPADPAAAVVGDELEDWDESTGRPARHGVVTVHVTGAVNASSVVRLEAGARVSDVVEAAGGVTPDADLDRINLARIVDDGEQVHVPRAGEHTEHDGGTTHDGRVDINRADATTLETLPGIGPTRAAAIIDHREQNGAFTAPGDLRAVSGIGEATFQNLADLVVVR